MTRSVAVFLSCWLVSAAVSRDDPRSSSHWSEMRNVLECPTSCQPRTSDKFNFSLAHTYVYTYEGHSVVTLKNGQSDFPNSMSWKSVVNLTWITPCGMSLFLDNLAFDGQTGMPPFNKGFTTFPLAVFIVEGEVMEVYTFEKDSTDAVNFKKGIVSAMQNSLKSSVGSKFRKIISESDVTGRCPTMYHSYRQGNVVSVLKEKNYKDCERRFIHASESESTSWLAKTPLPVEHSRSTCKQQFKDDLFVSVKCHDFTQLRPYPDSPYWITGETHSRLDLRSVGHLKVPQTIPGRLRPAGLALEYASPTETADSAGELEELLEELCSKLEEDKPVERDAASVLAQVVRLMKRSPEENLRRTFLKVRNKEPFSGGSTKCDDRMETILLDVVASLHRSSAVRIMVDELVSKRASAARTLKYSTALNLLPRPTLSAVEAVTPILLDPSGGVPLHVALASATLVNNYCRLHSGCLQEEKIKDLLSSLAEKVLLLCRSDEGSAREDAILAHLKVIGNLDASHGPLIDAVLCFLRDGRSSNSVKLSAVSAVRKVSCQSNVAEFLLLKTFNAKESADIRIASFLTALPCVDSYLMNAIITNVTAERNYEVRNFILSHLREIQSSNTPVKGKLRSLLATHAIPPTDNWNPFEVSQSFGYSFYSPRIQSGFDLENEVVHSGFVLPTYFGSSTNLDILGSYLDFLQVEFRHKHLGEVIENTLQYLRYVLNNILEDVILDSLRSESDTLSQNIKNILLLIAPYFSQNINTDEREFDQTYTGNPELDMLLRILGQDVSFISLKKLFLDYNADFVIGKMFELAEAFLEELETFKYDIATADQININYYLATIQGIPLKLNLELTEVFGINAEGNLDILSLLLDWKGFHSSLKLQPAFSAHISGFIGVDIGHKCGLKLETSLHASPRLSTRIRGIENTLNVIFDFPLRMDIITVKSHIYHMKQLTGQEKEVLLAPGERTRWRHQQCSGSQGSTVGLELCHSLSIPNIFNELDAHLAGRYYYKVYLKRDRNVESIIFYTHWKSTKKEKTFETALLVPGTAHPEKYKVGVKYRQTQQDWTILAYGYLRCGKAMLSRVAKLDMISDCGSDSETMELKGYWGENHTEPNNQVLNFLFGSKILPTGLEIMSSVKTLRILKAYLDLSASVEASFGTEDDPAFLETVFGVVVINNLNVSLKVNDATSSFRLSRASGPPQTLRVALSFKRQNTSDILKDFTTQTVVEKRLDNAALQVKSSSEGKHGKSSVAVIINIVQKCICLHNMHIK